ncbi:hypothetical protein IPJ72_00380 [Candidatus Peregrinibacteria bacterium]|nr:MAG: hypothetical protein IPJ72_00380 [Candidatus Peregrinibacteria bacterium]
MNGDIPQAIIHQDDERVSQLIERFLDVFGPDHFFFELQDHPTHSPQVLVNQRLIELGRLHHIGLVATGDVHYVNSSDNEAQDIELCIGMARNLDDPGRFSMMNFDYSMRDPQRYLDAFSEVPEAILNTQRIAERCTVTFDLGHYLIPKFPVPDNKAPEDYLRELCFTGLKQKYQLTEPVEELMRLPSTTRRKVSAYLRMI